MAEPNPNMLEIAKKLIPDIEENMPASLREAFETGKIKSIFRTGYQDINAETGKRFAAGASTRPSSHYFLLDDGRAARYGIDDTGKGWMGARASVPDVVMNQDDPFVFDNIFFGDRNQEGLSLGDNISESLPAGASQEPIIGKNIFETMSEDGIITRSHGGNAVKDIYRRDGTATFFEDAADAVTGVKPNLVTSTIEDLDFVERTGKAFPVRLPRLKSGSSPLSPSAAAPKASRLKVSKTSEPEIDNATRLAEERIRIIG